MTSENFHREWIVLRHVEHEHVGTLSAVLHREGIEARYVDLFLGDSVPENPSGFSGLIVMGGPMGVYESDRYPFLKQEQELIRRVADSGLPVLGICLGAQLIASSFGARVYPGPSKEIGWHRVQVTAPGDKFVAGLPLEFMGFHWHGDTFDLPSGAARLFRSSLYENQGFRYGPNVLAIQFHFEVSAAMVGEWLEDGGCCAEPSSLPEVSPDTIRRETAQWAAQTEELSREIFGSFVRETAS